MEYDYFSVDQIVFQLLESMIIIESTKNIMTLLSRYEFCLQLLEKLNVVKENSEYKTHALQGASRFSIVYKRIISEMHENIFLNADTVFFKALSYSIFINRIVKYFTEEVDKINALKMNNARIKRFEKLLILLPMLKEKCIEMAQGKYEVESFIEQLTSIQRTIKNKIASEY